MVSFAVISAVEMNMITLMYSDSSCPPPPDKVIALVRDVERDDSVSHLLIPPLRHVAVGHHDWEVVAPVTTALKALALARCSDLERKDLGLPPLVGHDLGRSSAATMG
jgi:hypothetical protein